MGQRLETWLRNVFMVLCCAIINVSSNDPAGSAFTKRNPCCRHGDYKVARLFSDALGDNSNGDGLVLRARGVEEAKSLFLSTDSSSTCHKFSKP
ncbi:unnamed protein product [Euphydryas editha]|uniref:Uncharacterized protein n=1 Tax=Euphydryas editha TaxID=104508 RepID=A0AAU9U8C4_EUPED|nr:unnamed protein product [Euphydryas editha]